MHPDNPETGLFNHVWDESTGKRTNKFGGRVIGVSAGTGPTDKAAYVTRPTGTYTWGTGAFLLAACAYHNNGPDR